MSCIMMQHNGAYRTSESEKKYFEIFVNLHLVLICFHDFKLNFFIRDVFLKNVIDLAEMNIVSIILFRENVQDLISEM